MTIEKIRQNDKYFKILRNIAPDILINCLAVNYKWPLMGVDEIDAGWNTSTPRVNNVMYVCMYVCRIYNAPYVASDSCARKKDDLNNDRLATTADVSTTPSGVSSKKLYVIYNTLTPTCQTVVAEQLRERLGLSPTPREPLNIIVSTNMDPWPTATSFLDVFRRELRQSSFDRSAP